jgi:uncharacterized membrane protein
MATATTPTQKRVGTPRTLLRADGALVFVSGGLLLPLARPLSSFLGLDSAASLMVLGGALVVYGGALQQYATRRTVERGLLVAVALCNVAWSIASLSLVTTQASSLTAAGRWLVAAQAVAVGGFAAVQLNAARDYARVGPVGSG